MKKVLENSSSGGFCSNDGIVHMTLPGLPFGGVGMCQAACWERDVRDAVICVTSVHSSIQETVDLVTTMVTGALRRSVTSEQSCCVVGLWKNLMPCATHRIAMKSWAGCAGPPHPRAAQSCDDRQEECEWEREMMSNGSHQGFCNKP